MLCLNLEEYNNYSVVHLEVPYDKTLVFSEKLAESLLPLNEDSCRPKRAPEC